MTVIVDIVITIDIIDTVMMMTTRNTDMNIGIDEAGTIIMTGVQTERIIDHHTGIIEIEMEIGTMIDTAAQNDIGIMTASASVNIAILHATTIETVMRKAEIEAGVHSRL